MLARDESLSLRDLLAQIFDSLRLIFLVQKDSFLSLFTGFNENNHRKTCKLKFQCYFRRKHRSFFTPMEELCYFCNEKRLTQVKFWLIPCRGEIIKPFIRRYFLSVYHRVLVRALQTAFNNSARDCIARNICHINA